MSSIYEVKTTSDHKPFECSSEESILQAGLRAGLPLRYKCSNGSCGQCKSQLLKGETHSLLSHDSPLSEQERANGWFLPCTHAPTCNLEILPPLFEGAIEIPHQTIQCKVKGIQRVTPGLTILTLRTPRSNTFQFLAGQDVTLSHLQAQHRYPLASCPCNGGELEFHIPYQEEDPFSQLLFSSLKKWETVTVEGPQGLFLLNEESGRHLIFIAWESGFGPISSLIQHFISLEMENPLSFYWLSREVPYLENHARSWGSVLDPFYYQWIEPATCDPKALAALLVEQLQQDIPIEMCDFYIAAPASLLIALGEQLLATGLEETQLRGSPL